MKGISVVSGRGGGGGAVKSGSETDHPSAGGRRGEVPEGLVAG